MGRNSNNGSTVTMSMAAGGLINIAAGAGIQNGGWQNMTWTNNHASLTLSGSLDIWDGNEVIVDALNGNGVLTHTQQLGTNLPVEIGINNGSGTFTGTITNASGYPLNLNKLGTGIEVLTGNNNYTGGTTITAGTLQIGNGGAGATIASTSAVLDSGWLVFNHSDAQTVLASINGTGQVVQTGNGVTTFSSAAISYSGATTISGGTLAMSNPTSFHALGGIVFSNNAALNLNVNSGSTVTFEQNLSSTAGTTTLSGLGILNKSGAGSVVFGASNNVVNVNFAAGSVINVTGGVLRNDYSNGNWANNKASLNVSGGTVDMWDSAGGITVDALNGSGTVDHTDYGGTENLTVGINNGSGTFTGLITDVTGGGGGGAHPLALVKAGTGVEVLTGADTYTGGTTISGGTLQLGNGTVAGSLLASGAILDNGTLAFGGGAATQGTNFSTAAITGSGGLVVSGGTVVLNAVNAYQGGTTISGGTLQVANNSALGSNTGPLALAAGLLNLNGFNPTVGGLSGAGTINDLSATASTLTVNNDNSSTTFGGTILSTAGAVTLAKAGTGALVLDSAQPLSANLAVTGGTLDLHGFDPTMGACPVGASWPI